MASTRSSQVHDPSCTLHLIILPIGFVFVFIIPVLYHLLRSSSDHFTYGISIGITSVLSIITFQYAVFWGEYSHCTNINPTDAHQDVHRMSHKLGVDCHNRHAMSAVCVFASCLFTLHILEIFFILFNNREILNTENFSSLEVSEFSDEFHVHGPMVIEHSLEKQIRNSSSLLNLTADISPRSSIHFPNSTDL